MAYGVPECQHSWSVGHLTFVGDLPPLPAACELGMWVCHCPM